MSSQQLGLVIIQATPFCNLDCSYCYLPGRSDTARISVETVATIFRQLGESQHLGDEVTIVWHAGEPLTVPADHYEQLFAAAALAIDGRAKLHHNFQTNATLVNESWVDFFKRHDVRVGVSLDGPEAVHNLHRTYRDGRGSFSHTIRGLRQLVSSGRPPTVISVVTSSLLTRAREFHDLMIEEGVEAVGLNVEEIEGIHSSSTLLVPANEKPWYDFVRELFRLSRVSGLRVREFEACVTMLNRRGRVLDDQSIPFAILSFASDGSYSTFSPELLTAVAPDGSSPFVFGNVHTGTLDLMTKDLKFLNTKLNIEAGNDACEQGCGYFQYCGGGAPANKWSEHRSFRVTETLYCRFRRQILAEAVLDELLAEQGEQLAR